MATDFQLNVKINGIEQTLKSVGDLERALQATNEQLKDVETNSKEFGFLTNQATNISNVFVAVNENATEFNNSLKSINVSAEQLGSTITSGADIATELRNAGDSAKVLDNDIKGAAKSGTSLRTELRKITMELQNLEPGSQKFQQLSLRAGELRDQIADTSAVINSLAGTSTERLGKALATTTQIGVAGFQSISAGAALFGFEGEDLQQTMVKLQALLNLSQAIETFGGLGDKITEIKAGFQSLSKDVETTSEAISNVSSAGKDISTAASTTQTRLNTEANYENAKSNTLDASASIADAGAKKVEQKATEGVTQASVKNVAVTTEQTIATEASAIASTADALAKDAETTATGAATVATTAFGTALKALPIIAIIASVASLAYVIYQMVSANEEAAKAEEERKKRLLESKKAQEEDRKVRDEVIKSVVQETSKLELLLFQLKATTNGSKERARIINDINGTYGTTLKNIQDETKFQKELNDTIADYIAYQRVRVLQDINDAKFTKTITDQQVALDKLKKLNISNSLKEQVELVALGKLKASDIDYSKDLILVTRDFSNMDEKSRKSLKNTVFAFEDYLGVVTSSNYEIERLGGTSAALSKQVEEFRTALNLNTKDTKTNTAAVKDLNEAEKLQQDILKQTAKIRIEKSISDSKLTQTLIDDINTERNIELESIKDRYDESVKRINEEVKDKKKAITEKTNLDSEYKKFQDFINNEYDGRVKERNAKELEEYQKLADALALENKILQTEIKYGDENTADTFEQLNQRKQQNYIDGIQSQIEKEREAGNLTLDVYINLLNQKKALQDEFNVKQRDLEISQIENSRRKELLNYQKSIKDKYGIAIELDDEYNLKASASLVKVEGESEESFNKRIENQKAVEQNFLKFRENLDVQYTVVSDEVNSRWNRKRVDDNRTAEQEILKVKIEYLDDYYKAFEDNLQQIRGSNNQVYIDLIDQTFTAIQTFTTLLEQDFETKGEKIAAWASTIGQTINAVIGAFVLNNKAALDEDLQNFVIASNERKDQLTREYNQGLINKQQYDAAIKNEDKNLKASELKAKKEAFEQDKKLRIAQATIAGITGAIAAFAGAMTLGPIAGPIVGGVLAAAVGVMTGVQIAQIKKQKFDSGGTTVEANVPDTNVAAQINAASSGGFTSFNEGVTGSPTGGTTTTTSEGNNYQKVYVLESDITNSQNRVRTLENNASFG